LIAQLNVTNISLLFFNFAGRISWSRQLLRQIEEPMMELSRHSQLMQSAEAKKIIRNYNKLSRTLLEYELMYYRSWLSQVLLFARWSSCICRKRL